MEKKRLIYAIFSLSKTNLNNVSNIKRKIFTKRTHLYSIISKIAEYKKDCKREKIIKDLIKLFNNKKNRTKDYY